MLDSFVALIPIFLIIGLGWFSRKTVFNGINIQPLSTYVLYFAMPILLFNLAAKEDLSVVLRGSAVIGFALAILIQAGMVAIVCTIFMRQNGEAITPLRLVIRAFNGTFPNLVYIGQPLISGLFGEQANTALLGMIIVGNLFIVAGAQMLMEVFSLNEKQQHTCKIQHLAQVFTQSVLLNPVLIAITLGIFVSYQNIHIWSPLQKSIDMIAPSAIPLALFSIGANFHFSIPKAHRREVIWIVVARLILNPPISIACFWLMGVREPIWLATAGLVTAIPTGALGQIFASRYGEFERQASQIIVFSTTLSIISIAIWSTLIRTWLSV